MEQLNQPQADHLQASCGVNKIKFHSIVKNQINMGQALWCTPVISALRRLR
jgi:hypothetical protein